jgi:hypothetical protein
VTAELQGKNHKGLTPPHVFPFHFEMSASGGKPASGGRRSSVDVKELDTLKRESGAGRPSSSKTTNTQASQASAAQSLMVSLLHIAVQTERLHVLINHFTERS